MVDELGESGAVEALAGDDVGKDAEGVGFEQAMALSVEALTSGRDAGGDPRMKIERFGDGFGVDAVRSVTES